MRNSITGFILGFAAIAFLIAPSLLCASGEASDYTGGVVVVLNRMDVLEPLQRGARQAVEFRDHAMWVLDDFLNRQVLPHLLPAQS
jgi:hypothetical protein